MRVAIFGAGAIGSLFGYLFAEHSFSVLLVGREPHVRAIDTSGLAIEGLVEGKRQIEARTDLPQFDSAELVLLTVKAGDVASAGAAIASALPAPVPVVAVQNGLGIGGLLEGGLKTGGWEMPRPWVVRGVNSYGATWVRPGVVRWAGDGEVLLPASGVTAGLAVDVLRRGGLRVRAVEDLPKEIWRKALVNAAINPITADHGVPNGALLDDPLRARALRLLHEAVVVAQAEGIEVTDDEAEEELWKVVRATATNRSSMLQDLDRGRPTELAWISEAILASATEHGLQLPETERAVARVHRRLAERAQAS